ncbi:hypothetical protein VTK73DRAFT_827 [Phialemonium thermophilum]|uniref:Uncharacterized protein n=1 Tax=Phialemonium thermophilum TaxID=223376 RepID=A0ABR3VU87_9PEZI
MALPSLLHVRRRHADRASSATGSPAATKASPSRPVSDVDIKRSTRLRRAFVTLASLFYLLSFVFLVLVDIGNTHNKPVLRQIYFFKLDLADIVPLSVPNAGLINSIARTLGLHDFYQVGLWNFCEGYNDVGITHCSKPKDLYWFDPVRIILSELLAGATIALPTEVVTLLHILRLVSHLMFGFFLSATVLAFVLVFATPLALLSRWWSLPFALISLVALLLTLAGSAIGTAISLAFKYAAESRSDLNIHVYVGTRMFVFMWLATGFALFAFAVHAGLGCCCASRRDIRNGRRPVKGAATG